MVGRGFPERNWDDYIARSAAKTVEAFRKGCGPDVGIMLDTNFHFRTEGFRRIAEAVGPTRLTWLELDAHDPKSIALIRRDSPVPIASGETLLERRDFRPYFESYAFDTAIVDVVWNGFYELLKIAAMADVYEVNVAPHNFYGHLASAISAHFCAAVPNFRIMEIDIDSVKWRDEFFDSAADDRGRRLCSADRPGLGRRGERSRGARAPAKGGERRHLGRSRLARYFSLTPTTRRMPSWMGTKPSSRSVCAIRYCG